MIENYRLWTRAETPEPSWRSASAWMPSPLIGLDKLGVGIVLNFLVFFLFLSLFSLTSFAGTYQATITKITDGDTVWVKMHHKRVKLRLLGIDTPEEYYSKKMLKDVRMCHTKYKKMRKLGLLATKHAKTMFYKGEKIKVITKGKGYYGRTLAFIILPDRTNYNEREVADGYACVYKWHGHKSKELSEEEFKKLEGLMEKAKEKKRGLWGIDKEVMECLCE